MDERRLILMRHAKSSWKSPARTDFERPLNRRGRRQATAMGRWLARQLPESPQHWLSSPALRAWQTCEAVMAGSGWSGPQPVMEGDIYAAGARCLLGLLRKQGHQVTTLMLTGHNPAIDDLVGYLLAQPAPLNGNGKLMSTASVAILRLERDWADVQANSARLQVLMRPRELPGELVDD